MWAITLSVDIEDFVVGFHEGFVRSRLWVFLFVSMVILRLLDLKM